MKNPIKTSHGIAILGTCFLLALVFTGWASKQFDYIATIIPPSSQTAAVADFDSSLVARYTFDEGSGIVANDYSSNGYNGNLTGVNGLPTWDTDKKVGTGALIFDDIDDRVRIPIDIPGTEGGQITVSAWVKPSNISGGGVIVSKDRSGFIQWNLYIDGKGANNLKNNLDFRVGAGGTNVTAVSDNEVMADLGWHHVAGVYDGANVYVYMDGISVDSTPPALTGNINNQGHSVCIGTSGATCTESAYFGGSIDDVRIYNRALSSSEIQELYNYNDSGSVTPPQDSEAPTTPTNLSVQAISTSQINLAWNASTDNTSVTGYRIYRNGSSLTTTSALSYSNTGLSANTSYSYAVLAYDVAGNTSAQSASVSTTTKPNPSSDDTTPPNGDQIAPSVPGGLKAIPLSPTGVRVTWNPSTDNVGVTGYNIYRCQGYYGCGSTGPAIGTSTSTSFIDTGVAPASIYRYRVSAYDARGNTSARTATYQTVTYGLPGPACVGSSFAFGVFSDNYAGQDTGMTAVFNRMMITEPNTQLIVGPGDQASFTRQRNLIDLALVDSLKCGSKYFPYFPAPGNHDAESPSFMNEWATNQAGDWANDPANSPLATQLNGVSNFRRGPLQVLAPTGLIPVYPATIYSFDYKSAHFIFVNNYEQAVSDVSAGAHDLNGPTVFNPTNSQLDWLREDLSQNTKPFVFVVGHTPLSAVFYDIHFPLPPGLSEHNSAFNNMAELTKLLSEYNITAYFNGHDHATSRKLLNRNRGTVYQKSWFGQQDDTTRTATAPSNLLVPGNIWQVDSGRVYSNGPSEFLIVKVDDTSATIETYYYPVGTAVSGTVPVLWDKFTILPNNSASINGLCSTPLVLNTCQSGAFSDITDTTTDALWSCLGTGTPPGSDDSCSLPIALDTTPPIRSGASPSGTLSAGSVSTSLSLVTNEPASCRYSNSAITAWSSMTPFSTSGATSHSSTVTGLQNGMNYNYYVKCSDALNNVNPDNLNISFSVGTGVVTSIYVDKNISVSSCTNYNVANRTCGTGNQIAYKDLNSASAVVNPGDTVNVRAGTYSRFIPTKSGNTTGHITFKAYSGETVIITQTGTIAGLDLNNKHYLIIDGFTVDNIFMWGQILNSTHNIIRNNKFTNVLDYGSRGSLRFVNSDHNKVLNNSFTNGNDSLFFENSNYNLAEGNTFVRARHTELVIACSNYNVIRANTFHNNLEKNGETFDCEGATSSLYDDTQQTRRLDATKHNIWENNIFQYTPPDPSGTEGPFNALQYAGQDGIIRSNIFYGSNGIGLGMAMYSDEALNNRGNRIYNNVFHDNIGGAIETSMSTNQNNFSNNIFKNNIIYANIASSLRWADNRPGGSQTSHRSTVNFLFDNNNIINQTASEQITYIGGALRSLVSMQSTYPGLFVNNIELSPSFVNASGRDYHLTATSPMINAGVFLTTTRSAGSGTSLPVTDARYFTNGFGIEGEVGDTIQLQGQTATAIITSVNYTTNTLTLDRSLSWSANQGVSLTYSGSSPDIGAYEYTGTTVILLPVITFISSSNITTNSATISWSTTGVSSQVFYGLTTGYGSNTSPTPPTSLTTQTLSGLDSNSVYYYKIRVTNSAGNSVDSEDYQFTTAPLLDSQAPTISITAPTNNSTVSGSAVPITISASDPTISGKTTSGVAVVQIKVDGANIQGGTLTTPTSGTTYSGTWNTIGVSNGSHVITVVATDTAGNSATSAVVNVTVSNIANRAPTANAGNNQTITLPSTATLSGSGSDPDGQTVTYTWSRVPGGGGTATFSNTAIANPTVSFSRDGSYTLRLTVSDGSLTDIDNLIVTVNPVVVDNTDTDGDGVPNISDKCPHTPPAKKNIVNNVGCPKPKNTKFTTIDLANVDLRAVESLKLNNDRGSVEFSSADGPYVLVRSNGTTEEELDLDSVDILQASITLSSTTLPELNKKATITFKGIDFNNPTILRDNIVCPNTDCVIIPSSGGDFSFTVSHFTTYTVVEGVPPPPPVDLCSNITGVQETIPSGMTASGGICSTPSGGGGGGGGTFIPTVPQLTVPIVIQTLLVNTTPSLCTPYTSPFFRNLTLGSTGIDVKQLQIFLNSKGFTVSTTGAGSKGNETTYFGPATTKALSRFQSANNIYPTLGYFGTLTMTKVKALSSTVACTSTSTPIITLPTNTTKFYFTRSLTLGSTGTDVKQLQIFLNSKGFTVSTTGAGSKGNESTYFGPATTKALIRYQQANNIYPSVGFFGPLTRWRVNG